MSQKTALKTQHPTNISYVPSLPWWPRGPSTRRKCQNSNHLGTKQTFPNANCLIVGSKAAACGVFLCTCSVQNWCREKGETMLKEAWLQPGCWASQNKLLDQFSHTGFTTGPMMMSGISCSTGRMLLPERQNTGFTFTPWWWVGSAAALEGSFYLRDRTQGLLLNTDDVFSNETNSSCNCLFQLVFDITFASFLPRLLFPVSTSEPSTGVSQAQQLAREAPPPLAPPAGPLHRLPASAWISAHRRPPADSAGWRRRRLQTQHPDFCCTVTENFPLHQLWIPIFPKLNCKL